MGYWNVEKHSGICEKGAKTSGVWDLVMENKLQCTCIMHSLLFIYLYIYIYDMLRSGKLLHLKLLFKHYLNMGNVGYLIKHNGVTFFNK